MEPKEMSMTLAGREFKIRNYPITTAASGYALVSLGDTVIMANASMSDKGREGADWFPMVVDYEENFYAAGKIKGSRFIKRSGRPSENAILTSRLIDRPIRPLFPKGTTNEVQIICSALSADLEVDPATTAINAASAALMVSGAPFEGPVGAVRMGYVDGELIVNPTYTQCDEGQLDLVVAGTIDAIAMVEAAAKEVSEDVLLEALDIAHKHIKEICELQIKYAEQFEVERLVADIPEKNQAAIKAVEDFVTDEILNEVKGKTKKEVKKKVKAIEEKIIEKYQSEIEEEQFSEGELKGFLGDAIDANMRKNILEKSERIDGRKVDEIRPVSSQVDILPRTHGSAIFQRGETMALTITTLGGPGDAQIVDRMDADLTRRYFHHYNFPPFSTGDIKPLRGASRREIGHGDLAERALLPVLPTKEEFPYTMWLVSEIVSCNGSSSMASVCGSTLSLMASGVPIKRPVAGIAMGLVMDKESGNYKILSDIQGLEDFAGDMDFKVTGTSEGITALQMDIKIKGLSTDLMREALNKAKEGRQFIMDKMLEAISKPRTELSKNAPMIMSMQINPDYIRTIIGKGGETIQKITEECNCEIDISDEGLVTITAPTQEDGQKAKDWINRLTYEPEVGDIFEGKVVRIMDFGAFVEIKPGTDGLVHISQLANERVNKVEDVVSVGDTLKVKLVEKDSQGRYNLSHKAVLNEDTKKSDSTATPEESKGDKPEQGKGGHGTTVPGTTSVRKID